MDNIALPDKASLITGANLQAALAASGGQLSRNAPPGSGQIFCITKAAKEMGKTVVRMDLSDPHYSALPAGVGIKGIGVEGIAKGLVREMQSLTARAGVDPKDALWVVDSSDALKANGVMQKFMELSKGLADVIECSYAKPVALSAAHIAARATRLMMTTETADRMGRKKKYTI